MPNGVTIVRDYIQGKDVLDLGCGHTLYGIGFLVYGARSYLGIDPKLKLDAPKLRRRERFRTELAGSSWTLREVAGGSAKRSLCGGGRIADLPAGDRFDVIFMHNVTEHLMAIEEVFAGSCGNVCGRRAKSSIATTITRAGTDTIKSRARRPRSILRIAPRRATLIGPTSTSIWSWHPPMGRRLNRIRLHEFRALTGRFFKHRHAGRSSIATRSKERSGSERSEIMAKLSSSTRTGGTLNPGGHVRVLN